MRIASDIAIKPSGQQQIARNLAGNEGFLQIALIEIPPYGRASIRQNTPCTFGRLDDTKDWFVTTTAAGLISEDKVKSPWDGEAPDFKAIVRNPEGGQKTAQNMFRSYQQIIHMARYNNRREVRTMIELLDDW